MAFVPIEGPILGQNKGVLFGEAVVGQVRMRKYAGIMKPPFGKVSKTAFSPQLRGNGGGSG